MLEKYHASRMRKIVDEKNKEKVRTALLISILDKVHGVSLEGKSEIDVASYKLNSLEIDVLKALGYTVSTSKLINHGAIVSETALIKW